MGDPLCTTPATLRHKTHFSSADGGLAGAPGPGPQPTLQAATGEVAEQGVGLPQDPSAFLSASLQVAHLGSIHWGWPKSLLPLDG